MKLRKTIHAKVSEEDALHRADRLLRMYGFKKVGQTSHSIYERSEPYSWSYALRPRTLFTTVHLFSEPAESACSVTVETAVHTLFGNTPCLGRKLVEGEINDLVAAVSENKLPVVNRQRQNKLAGTTQLLLLACTFVISLALGFIGWTLHPIIGLLTYLSVLLGGSYLLNRLQLPLLPFPDFPIKNPPGATLVSERKEENIPVAPKRRS